MTEQRNEVRVIQVTKQCPKCAFGKLEFNGSRYMNMDGFSSQNYHKCNICKHSEHIHCKQYPCIEYETI
jgi:hypothetical protein